MNTVVPWGSLHTHCKYSAKDAVDHMSTMVSIAASIGYGALGNTDHGVVAGNFELYRYCRKAGIIPVPGCEFYVAFDRRTPRPLTWHMGVLATTTKGWSNLISLANLAHRQFKYKPIIDLADLQHLGSTGLLEGLWATTGCFFGILESALRVKEPSGASVVAGSNIVRTLQDAFGGRVLMELQNHGIVQDDHDDDALVDLVDTLAQSLSVPTLITTDSHYARRGSEGVHQMLKRLSSWSTDPDEAVFPGNGYWLTSEKFMRRRFEPDVWNRALEGFQMVVGEHDMQVPEIDTFVVKAPKLSWTDADPDVELYSETKAEITRRQLPARYHKRLEEELEVVLGKGFSSYLLLAMEVTDFCRDSGIKFVVRGSASGSLICWLLGITQLDPLKWKLRFDRFLSTDRSKPPDIDIDVENERRQEVLDHMGGRYAVAHIGTWREVTDSKDDDSKGSVWVKWKTYSAKTGEVLTPNTKQDIHRLANARTYDGIGVHAAGLVIMPDVADLQRVPMQYIASSKKFVCSLDKDEIEALGYVKLDVLGLKTLTAVKEMEEWTGVPMEDIPMSDATTMTMIRSGFTDAVFQLNGGAQKRGLPRLKPQKFEDIVIALALFRPAVMNSGAMDEYLSLRNGNQARKVHHPVIEKHVASTHGVILFQEQVLGILRDIGLDPVTVNVVLKAVKASNAAIGNAAQKMEEVRLQVVPLCISAGFSDKDIEWLEGAMQAYAAYGFNRAHAVSYAHMSWRTAWYKKHHPLEYWCAMVRAYRGGPKEIEIRAAMRLDRIRVLKAHINQSDLSYSLDRKRGAIRAGLTSIKGVGDTAAAVIARNAPYTSLEDFAARANSRAVTGINALQAGHSPASCGGVVDALAQAGAFAGLLDTKPTQLELDLPTTASTKGRVNA